jgi:serine/threonine protein kinase/WD40 repeat protein
MAKPSIQQVEELFHQAAALASGECAAFLDGACPGDPELRAAVEELLQNDTEQGDTHTFLVSPLADAAAACRSDAPTRPSSPAVVPANAPWPRIPGYQLLAELGRGGIGVVYLARQASLNRLVALKMLLPATLSWPEHQERFRTEAETLARLNHPNIVPIFDIGTAAGQPFFTMEYVPGPSLARVLNGQPQDPSAAARMLETLARTIHTVHQRGVIHRDLKPANVLLRPVGGGRQEAEPKSSSVDLSLLPPPSSLIPKVTDFGLAKDLAASRKLTQTGAALGTPAYMAPEQVRNVRGGVGRAADIYALGSILYEMLTGRPPFLAETLAETWTQLLNEEPLPPARLRPRLPRDLATICLKCLEKSPRKRYTSAWDLAEDLRRFQAGEPIRARPVGPIGRALRWCRRRPLVASLIALSAALAVAFLVTVLVYDVLLSEALARAQAKADKERRQIIQLNIRLGIDELEGGDNFLALLHFAEAFRLDEADREREPQHRTRIGTALRSGPRLLRLWTPEQPALCAHLGASGGRLATTSVDHLIEVWDLMTGRPIGPALPLDDQPLRGAFARDGQALATVSRKGTVRVWDLTTGTGRDLPSGSDQPVREVAFCGDGNGLLTRYADSAFRLWDLTGQPPVPLDWLSGGDTGIAVLSDDGRWLFTFDWTHRGRVWDLTTGKTVAQPLLPEQKPTVAAISPDGRRVAVLGADSSLRVWDLTAAGWVGTPLRPQGTVRRVLFSPDAGQVVALGNHPAVQAWHIPSGKSAAFLPEPTGPVTEAQFSPDGSLVVTSNSPGEVIVWDVAAGLPVTPPLRHLGPLALAAFGPGGRQFVTVGQEGTVRLWELPTEPERPEAPSDWGGSGKDVMVGDAPRLVTLRDGTTVRVDRPSAGGRLRPPADGLVEHAVFRPDGRRVVVTGNDAAARVWDVTTGERLTPPLRHGGMVVYATFSPDGLRLLTAAEDLTARVWDAATGELLAPPRRLAGPLRHASFEPDGYRAVLVSEEGVVSTWNLKPDSRPVDELVALAQVLSGSRMGAMQEPRGLGAEELLAAWRKLSPTR